MVTGEGATGVFVVRPRTLLVAFGMAARTRKRWDLVIVLSTAVRVRCSDHAADTTGMLADAGDDDDDDDLDAEQFQTRCVRGAGERHDNGDDFDAHAAFHVTLM